MGAPHLFLCLLFRANSGMVRCPDRLHQYASDIRSSGMPADLELVINNAIHHTDRRVLYVEDVLHSTSHVSDESPNIFLMSLGVSVAGLSCRICSIVTSLVLAVCRRDIPGDQHCS
jgi:hypothetical protein